MTWYMHYESVKYSNLELLDLVDSMVAPWDEDQDP